MLQKCFYESQLEIRSVFSGRPLHRDENILFTMVHARLHVEEPRRNFNISVDHYRWILIEDLDVCPGFKFKLKVKPGENGITLEKTKTTFSGFHQHVIPMERCVQSCQFHCCCTSGSVNLRCNRMTKWFLYVWQKRAKFIFGKSNQHVEFDVQDILVKQEKKYCMKMRPVNTKSDWVPVFTIYLGKLTVINSEVYAFIGEGPSTADITMSLPELNDRGVEANGVSSCNEGNRFIFFCFSSCISVNTKLYLLLLLFRFYLLHTFTVKR